MTEAEWQGMVDPMPMLEYLKGKASDRKLRLFACACCRAVWATLTHGRSKQAVELAERCADGLVDDAALGRAHSMANDALAGYQYQMGVRRLVNRDGPSVTEWRLGLAAESAHVHRPFLVGRLRAVRCDPELRAAAPALLREVFGPTPAAPAVADPLWLTDTVLAVARGIYADCAFDRMLILADALEDAGCEDADVLAHCRGGGHHVKGCWVVDALLGRK